MGRAGGSVRAPDDIGSAGLRIKERRKALGLSQQALAEQAGVSRQTIVSLESGDYAPSVYLSLTVARLLGATVEDLWG
jgi:putative transcriptional regulator